MRNFLFVSFTAMLFACGGQKKPAAYEPKEIPVLGSESITAFGFVDQNGDTVTEASVNGKIWVADFFFTSCPTICPKMKNEMLRVWETFKDEDRVLILSHTIDPEHDTREVLKDFADRLEITGNRWRFLTGDKDSIYAMAERYMISAAEDPSAPGGFVHSGAFVLLDGERRIRGYYDGTNPQAVDTLMADMKFLLK
jgi:protein SCO1/2